MKKKTNMTGPIIIGILLLVALLVGTGTFSTLGGLTVTSISAPNVISNDQSLENLNWLVTTQLSGGDQIVYTIQPSEFESKSGVSTDNPFKITAKGISETLEYRINARTDFLIYKYYITDIVSSGTDCSRIITGAEVYKESPRWLTITGYKKFCVLRSYEGRYGTLSQPTVKFEADLEISNTIDTYTKKISSDLSSVAFTDKNNKLLATASWTGSLVKGNPPPSLPEIGILSTRNSNRWALVSQSKFTQYQIAQNNFQSTVLSIPSDGIIDSTSLLNSLKSLNSQLDNTRTSTIYNYDLVSTQYTLVNPTSTSDAKMIYTSKTQILSPQIQWWIRADWLGVERQVGKPQITAISSKRFGNEEQGIITLSVKNIGTGIGNFKATLDSCPTFKQTFVSSDFQVTPGSIVDTEIYVDAGSKNIDLTSTCNVKVYDTTNPTNFAVRPVTLGFDATRVCTPGQYSSDVTENAIYKCNADGLGLTKVKQCDSTEIVKVTGQGNTGGFECVAKDPATKDPEGNFSWILFTITLIGSSVLAAYVYTITRGVSQGFKIALAIGAFILAFILIPTLVNAIIGLFTIGKVFSVIPI